MLLAKFITPVNAANTIIKQKHWINVQEAPKANRITMELARSIYDSKRFYTCHDGEHCSPLDHVLLSDRIVCFESHRRWRIPCLPDRLSVAER
jgi:hypothetical protein